MNNAQRVVVQLMGDTTNGAPTEAEHRPPPASRLPSWVVRAPAIWHQPKGWRSQHMVTGIGRTCSTCLNERPQP